MESVRPTQGQRLVLRLKHHLRLGLPVGIKLPLGDHESHSAFNTVHLKVFISVGFSCSLGGKRSIPGELKTVPPSKTSKALSTIQLFLIRNKSEVYIC